MILIFLRFIWKINENCFDYYFDTSLGTQLCLITKTLLNLGRNTPGWFYRFHQLKFEANRLWSFWVMGWHTHKTESITLYINIYRFSKRKHHKNWNLKIYEIKKLPDKAAFFNYKIFVRIWTEHVGNGISLFFI